jgi:hypothetical protein
VARNDKGMKKIPLTVALFTSAKGHWGVKDRYLETIRDLDRQIPLNYFSSLIANVKQEPINEGYNRINHNLDKYGFEIFNSYGRWDHGEQSHQDGYLSDINFIYNQPSVLKVPYVLHLEDDWQFHCYEDDLVYWIDQAISVLEEYPNIAQVRFPRFSNEFERIKALRQKHGINSFVAELNNEMFLHNDFSLNPSIFRSRDMMTAINLLNKNQQTWQRHVEHGLGAALKYLYDVNQLPFVCLNPNKVKVRHIGSPVGEEDSIEPLIST